MSDAARKPLRNDVALVAFDVDGVFTDGRFYLSDDGVESKAFHTQDGFGIRQMLRAGIHIAVISGRSSGAVAARMDELGVEHVFQGCGDKVSVFHDLLEKLGIDPSRTVYVGDDEPDLPLLDAAGYSIAVANAVRSVRDACDAVTSAPGGCGAVREVCERILAAREDE